MAENPRWFRGTLALYEDTAVTILIERKKRGKSKEQLGYYWGVVLPYIAEHTGHSADELHEIFKRLFLKNKHFWRGNELTTIGSTQSLSSNEMAEFITNVIHEAAEMEIEIPPADKMVSIIRTTTIEAYGKENTDEEEGTG